jgi:hypothetical protein
MAQLCPVGMRLVELSTIYRTGTVTDQYCVTISGWAKQELLLSKEQEGPEGARGDQTGVKQSHITGAH